MLPTSLQAFVWQSPILHSCTYMIHPLLQTKTPKTKNRTLRPNSTMYIMLCVLYLHCLPSPACMNLQMITHAKGACGRAGKEDWLVNCRLHLLREVHTYTDRPASMELVLMLEISGFHPSLTKSWPFFPTSIRSRYVVLVAKGLDTESTLHTRWSGVAKLRHR